MHNNKTIQRGAPRLRPLRQAMQAMAIVMMSFAALATLATSAQAAPQGPTEEGGRFLPVADGTKKNLEGSTDLYTKVDEYPRRDGDAIRLNGAASTGSHRLKFGVMNRDSDSVCATVRAKKQLASATGKVRTVLYSGNTLVERGDWRELSEDYGDYIFNFDTSGVDLNNNRLVIKVELLRTQGGGTIWYSQAYARLDCQDWLHAKLLGYAFGDGNYTADALENPSPTLAFKSGQGVLARDFVEHGCAAGYPVTLNNVDRCRQPFDSEITGRFKIAGFSYPSSTFANFAQEASSDERRAFLSGMIPTEGNASKNLVDDQFFSGPYKIGPGETAAEVCDRIDERMVTLVDLMDGGDFSQETEILEKSAKACRNDGDGRAETNEIFVTPEAACKFNSVNGYEFTTLGRVPSRACQ